VRIAAAALKTPETTQRHKRDVVAWRLPYNAHERFDSSAPVGHLQPQRCTPTHDRRFPQMVTTYFSVCWDMWLVLGKGSNGARTGQQKMLTRDGTQAIWQGYRYARYQREVARKLVHVIKSCQWAPKRIQTKHVLDSPSQCRTIYPLAGKLTLSTETNTNQKGLLKTWPHVPL
jgi:hypothetical protein